MQPSFGELWYSLLPFSRAGLGGVGEELGWEQGEIIRLFLGDDELEHWLGLCT